jgi:acyl-CoA thioester hydrolase
MPLSYSHHLTVPSSAIDLNGHVNNVVFIQWMQDAAVAHSTAVGAVEVTQSLNALWVVRRHTIEYRRQAFLGDEIEIKTWIADCRLVSSRRKYEFHRTKDQTLLARGETDWVLIDATTHKPLPIPESIQKLYVDPANPDPLPTPTPDPEN